MVKLLLIEQDCTSHEPLADALEPQGFHVVCSHDLADAKEQLRVWKPQIVLVNGGNEHVIREVKKTRDVPVVALADSTMNCHADSTLVRPIDLPRLVQTLHQMLAA